MSVAFTEFAVAVQKCAVMWRLQCYRLLQYTKTIWKTLKETN